MTTTRLARNDRLFTNRRIMSRGLTGKMSAVSLAAASTVLGMDPSTTGLSISMRIGLAAAFDQFRILIPNIASSQVAGITGRAGFPTRMGLFSSGAPTGITGAPAATNGGPQSGGNAFAQIFNTTTNDDTRFLPITFGNGGASATLPAAPDATNYQPSWTASDWLTAPSQPRTAETDGTTGVRPLIDIRLYFPASAGSITIAGSGSGSDVSQNGWGLLAENDPTVLSNPGARGGRGWRSWVANVDMTQTANDNAQWLTPNYTTPASAVASTTPTTLNWTVPIIVQYRSTIDAIQVMGGGDSIWEGIGSTANFDSFLYKAIRAVHTEQVPVEYCPVVMPGLQVSGGKQHVPRAVEALIDLVQPTLLVVQSASVNDYNSTQIAWLPYAGPATRGRYQRLALKNRSKLIVGNFAPTNYTSHAYGSSDSLRVADNSALAADATANGYQSIDLSSAFSPSGSTSNGQLQPDASLTLDGIHPNEAGHLALQTPTQAALASAITDLTT